MTNHDLFSIAIELLSKILAAIISALVQRLLSNTPAPPALPAAP